MALLSPLRLRRILQSVSAVHRSFSAASAPTFSVLIQRAVSPTPPSLQSPSVVVQSRAFRSSSISLLSSRSSPTNNPDEIGPDTILFEGCDYNHWLIVMDFPKDNKPSPEQMVETYEQTCAKGLNISLEEAKKKMYACSTTTYTGFQAVMTEEESKKFEGLPGVIFVLPDSYIDPVNKEYGGDKYINGTIIPRPPPIQYGRSQGRRDRNRNPGQYNRQENPMSNSQGNSSYNNRGSVQGDGRNFGASQNYPPQQNYGQASQNYPPQQNYGQASQNHPPQPNYGQSQNHPPQPNYGQSPQNYSPQPNYGQASQNYSPQPNYGQASQNYSPQSNYNQASPNYSPQPNYGQASQNYPQQQTYGPASPQRYGPASPQYAPQQSFGPPGQGERRNYVPTHGGSGASQVQRDAFVPSYMKEFEKAGSPSYVEDFKPSYMEEFEQAGQGNYFAKEQARSQQRYPPTGQGNFTGDNRNGDSVQDGNYGHGVGYQGTVGSHGQGSGYEDGQRFTQVEHRNEQDEQRQHVLTRH